jgi:hypothetical protein
MLPASSFVWSPQRSVQEQVSGNQGCTECGKLRSLPRLRSRHLSLLPSPPGRSASSTRQSRWQFPQLIGDEEEEILAETSEQDEFFDEDQVEDAA